MPARIRKIRHDEETRLVKPWRFYVYALFDRSGAWAYIGKGSGKRLSSQRSRFKLPGVEIARFKSEKRAFDFERALIAEQAPYLNRHPGGNGSTVHKRPERMPDWWYEIEKVGSRRYAAMILWRYRYLLSPEELIPVRQLLGSC